VYSYKKGLTYRPAVTTYLVSKYLKVPVKYICFFEENNPEDFMAKQNEKNTKQKQWWNTH
jgi:hypothetical protein